MPDQYRDYPCTEYFADGWAERGYFDEESQTPVIVPLAEAYEDRVNWFFAVGHSGCGGIDFGYRKGHEGLWAYHPIDWEFQAMAPTVGGLVEGWLSGELAV